MPRKRQPKHQVTDEQKMQSEAAIRGKVAARKKEIAQAEKDRAKQEKAMAEAEKRAQAAERRRTEAAERRAAEARAEEEAARRAAEASVTAEVTTSSDPSFSFTDFMLSEDAGDAPLSAASDFGDDVERVEALSASSDSSDDLPALDDVDNEAVVDTSVIDSPNVVSPPAVSADLTSTLTVSDEAEMPVPAASPVSEETVASEANAEQAKDRVTELHAALMAELVKTQDKDASFETLETLVTMADELTSAIAPESVVGVSATEATPVEAVATESSVAESTGSTSTVEVVNSDEFLEGIGELFSEKAVAAAPAATATPAPAAIASDANTDSLVAKLVEKDRLKAAAQAKQDDLSAEQRIKLAMDNLALSLSSYQKSIPADSAHLAKDLLAALTVANMNATKELNAKLIDAKTPEDFLQIERSDACRLVRNARTLADKLRDANGDQIKSLAAIKEFDVDTIDRKSVAGWIKSIVGTIVAAAVGLVLGAGLGFAAGFAAGIWTGPGAFFTAALGAISGATQGMALNAVLGTAVASGVGTLVGGGLFARSTFSESQTNNAARSVVKSANSLFAFNNKENAKGANKVAPQDLKAETARQADEYIRLA